MLEPLRNAAYKIVIQPPPGSIVAPNGFPANPRPPNAPQPFLDAMQIRVEVFCDEQNCALEPELDEDDPRSWQFIVYKEKQGDAQIPVPVSVIRLSPPPHPTHPNGFHDPKEEPYVKLSRVATVKEARRKGLSKMVIEYAFRWLVEHYGEVGEGWKGMVLTHAQVEVEGVYAKLGFVTDERLGRWDEEGIEHLGMWKRIDLSRS